MDAGVAGEASSRPTILPTQRMSQRLAQLLADQLRTGVAARKGRAEPPGELAWLTMLLPGLDKGLVHGTETHDVMRWLQDPASGQAMAFHSFLGWRQDLRSLALADVQGFRELRFGARLPTGVRGTPPQLELVAASEPHLVAVTSVGLSFLQGRSSRLAEAYRRIESGGEMTAWSSLAESYSCEHSPFRFVDVGALLRFAKGLAQTFPSHRTTLLYLFHEPTDAHGHALFARHRAELAALSERVRTDRVVLSWMSYSELWQAWTEAATPVWLRDIVAELRRRYDMAMGNIAGL